MFVVLNFGRIFNVLSLKLSCPEFGIIFFWFNDVPMILVIVAIFVKKIKNVINLICLEYYCSFF